jgi:hypothetical protein
MNTPGFYKRIILTARRMASAFPMARRSDRSPEPNTMDWKTYCRTQLPKFLDRKGDLTPPWERFPTYEQYSMGWRMGFGEDWMGMWHVFLEDFTPSLESKRAYLYRHPPAPIPWANTLYRILYPSPDDQKPSSREVTEEHRALLLQDGLIKTDVAYSTWLSQQQGVDWPWENDQTPEDAARWRTRSFWFWSRQVAELRNNPAWQPPVPPENWQSCTNSFHSGKIPHLDTSKGLLTLAQMFSAGRVIPPWQLGLTLSNFEDSFDDDMGYVDAFRLWGITALDDREQLEIYLTVNNAPEEWENWAQEQLLPEGYFLINTKRRSNAPVR